jgi:membrane-associated protease RseP (regulator of RpoE activity)
LPVGVYLLIGAVIGRGKSVRRARKALYIGIALLVLVVGFWIFQSIANGPDA